MADMEKTVQLRYRITGDEGVLEDGNGPKAKVDSYFLGDDDIGPTLNHVNYLKTICVNQTADGMEERIYEWFDYSLPEYVETLKPLVQVKWDPKNNLKKYRFVKLEIIEIIRAMISFVLYLHSKDLSFDCNLQAKYHFGISEGVLKFWRTKFQTASSHDMKRKDFHQIAHLISSDLLGGLKLETCMDDLIKKMSSNYEEHLSTTVGYSNKYVFKVKTEDFFQVHMALMSPSHRLAYMKNCIDKYDGMGKYAQYAYNDALHKMGENDNWIDKVKDSFPILMYSLDHQLAKRVDPKAQVNFSGVNVKKLLAQLRETYNDKVVNSNHHPVNKGIIRMCRNAATHLYEVAGKTMGKKDKVDDMLMNASIMHSFEKELLAFQLALFKRKQLDYFMI